MNWKKFFEDKERILQNLNEFTDDIIMSDGTLGVMPGSDADCFQYDEDELAGLEAAIKREG